jgi:type I restriction enzyme S subunit
VRAFALDLEDVRYLSGAPSDYVVSLIEPRDLLFTRYNGTRSLVGVCAIVPDINKAIVHPDKLIRARPLPIVAVPAFIALAANVGASRQFIEQRIRTTAGQAGVSGSDVKELPVPLPPSLEQEVISETVEDQLSIIDHLEADLDAKLKSAQGLRQATLRHAFTGKLVRQDPNDEPASKLLKRIAAEREARARGAAAAKRPKKNTNSLRLSRRRRPTTNEAKDD